MKEAVLIIAHALRILLGKPLVTLRVIAPALIVLGATGLLALFVAPNMLLIDHLRSSAHPLSSPVLTIAISLIFVIGYGLLAILWHRHVLRASAHARLSPLLFGRYMMRVLFLGLIQLSVSVTLVLPLLFAEGTGARPSFLAILMVTFLAQLLMLWVSLRFSLILPAAALGRPMSLIQSWRHTDDLARTLWGVAAILAAVNTGISAMLDLTNTQAPIWALILQLPLYILQGLLIFGVLTTLYAFLIDSSDKTRLRGIAGFVG